MADPFVSIAKSIIGLVLEIKKTVKLFRHNQKDCRRVIELIDKVSAAAVMLKEETPHSITQEQTETLMDAFKGMEETLKESLQEIQHHEQKNFAHRFVEASDVAEMLGRVRQHIHDEFVVVSLAMFACMMRTVQAKDANMMRRFDALDATMKELLVAVRDRDASGSGSSKVASLVKKIADDFSDQVRLPPEVQTYSYSSHHQSKKHKRDTTETESARKSRPQGSDARDGNGNLTSGESVTGQSIKKIKPRIRTMETKTPLRSIDVHPTKEWVVTTSAVGGCVIWDYQNMKKVMELQFKRKQACSAKFIVKKEWLAVGTSDGFIYIYSYTGTELREVYKFKADDKGYAITSLAVHPMNPYILSSSDFSPRIRQWYLRDDKEIGRRDINVTTVGVHGLKYNPRNAETFVAVTNKNTARIYTTEFSHYPTIILDGSSSADYYPTDSNQDFIVTCQNASSNCKIWNLATGKVVHTLQLSGRIIKQVACHTTQPILATSTCIENKDKWSTTLEDGTICLWDTKTCRQEKTVLIPGMGRSHHYMVFATDTKGLTRLFVMFGAKIAIVEFNLTMASTSRQTGGDR